MSLDLIVMVLGIVVGFNVLLGGAKKILDSFKDKTATTVDNQASDFLGKVAGLLQKAIDLVSGNLPH